MNVVVLADKNWGIGIKGDQMVFNKEDLKNYNKLTVGHTVVMGYTTLMSLPKGPLKDRKTIVFYDKNEEIEGVEVVNSLEEFLEVKKHHGEIFVSGGASIYRLLLPYCKYAYVTKLDSEYEVDTYFPNLDEIENWTCISEEKGKFGEGTSYCTYENASPLE